MATSKKSVRFDLMKAELLKVMRVEEDGEYMGRTERCYWCTQPLRPHTKAVHQPHCFAALVLGQPVDLDYRPCNWAFENYKCNDTGRFEHETHWYCGYHLAFAQARSTAEYKKRKKR